VRGGPCGKRYTSKGGWNEGTRDSSGKEAHKLGASKRYWASYFRSDQIGILVYHCMNVLFGW